MTGKNKKVALIFTLIIVILTGCGRQNVLSNNTSPIPTENTETGGAITPSSSPVPTNSPIETPIESLVNETLTPENASIPENTPKPNETKEYKTYTTKEIDEIKASKYTEITEPLIEQYIYWMHELDKEYSPKNLVMTAMYNDIAGGFFFVKESLNGENYTNWESETPNAYKYMSKETHYAPISAEITDEDFITIISIAQPLGDEYSEYYELVNEIRETKDEVEFLKGLNDLGYYAVDIYVEDMLQLDRRIPCTGVKFYEGYATDMKERHDNFTQMPEDDKLKEYLNKYGREINFDDELQNKAWNLFLFNKRDTQPAIIYLNIRSYFTEGGIQLRQKI